MEQQASERFEGWCICEIMGHQTFAGYVSERAIAGAGMLQIDVPEVDDAHPAFTKLFSPSAIYGLTPTTEAHAREAAAQIRVRPVTLYILPEPKQRPPLIADTYLDPEGDYDRYRDDDDDDEDDPDVGGFEGDDDEVDDPDDGNKVEEADAMDDDLSQTPIPF